MFPNGVRCYVDSATSSAAEGDDMATMSDRVSGTRLQHDYLTGTPRAQGLDRWIFVGMSLWFIALVLIGFIPDSVMKVEMIKAGLRPPFPIVLHMHAVLMGTFLLFLLSQTWLVATGRCELHRRIGPVGGVLAGALVVVGFILAPTMYHQVSDGLAHAPPQAQDAIKTLLLGLDNILLLQITAGVLFATFITMGLFYRVRDPGFHKRMMFIAPAMALGAAFARMTWLPHTIPGSPTSIMLYQLLALSPLFLWDVIRNRRIHRAYWVLAALYIPAKLLVGALWNTPWWHEMAPHIMGGRLGRHGLILKRVVARLRGVNRAHIVERPLLKLGDRAFERAPKIG